MKASRELLLLFLLCFVFIGLWLLVGNETPEERTDPRLSSYNATYPGLKAWYLLLEEMGYQPRRIVGTYADRLERAGALVLAEPTENLSDTHLRLTVKWVREGGHLILIGDDFEDLETGEFRAGISLVRERTPARTGTVAASTRSPLTDYVGRVYSGPSRFSDVPSGAETLYSDRHGPLLVQWREGRGRITALADPFPLSNRHINKAGNARLGIALAQEGMHFDEYHHGYGSEPGFWAHLGRPLQLAIWQIVFAALLMAWTASRRFGRAVVPPFEDRRAAGEYVVSLGSLLRRAKADETALTVIGHAFRRDLAAWAGAPPDLPDAPLLDAVAERASMPRETLRRALVAARGAPPEGMTALDACRFIATVREELNLNGRSATPVRHSG